MRGTYFYVIALAIASSEGNKVWDMTDMPIEIDSTDFYGKVAEEESHMLIGDKPWFIEFYSPYCGHCQKLAPTWDMLYRRNKETVNVARVNCTSDKGGPLCDEF